MDDNREPSVWYVASFAICIFVGLMVISSLFGSTEGVAIAAQ